MTTANIHSQKILILDFGSQYTQLIARRVRELGVYCEIWDYAVDEELFREFDPQGVVFSGSPESANHDESPRPPEFIYDAGKPILGICYGMQAMAEHFSGKVEASDKSEFGFAQVDVVAPNKLLDGIEDRINENASPQLDVWMSHGDKVTEVPVGFSLIAATESAPIAAMCDESRGMYGIQFHPEVTHTIQGLRILERFCHGICGCESLWTSANIIEDAIATVRAKVGKDKVLLGLSGGVDSSVVAALLHKAIGDQLTCVFVDNGLLRKKERELVDHTFRDHFNIDLRVVDASKEFLGDLEGVDDPQVKRKRIGHRFIEVFKEAAETIDGADFLAQGTLYPDVIESGHGHAGNSANIKLHHNVGGLPEELGFKLIEPLRELFKDEVRRLGSVLGVPDSIVWRHPFPGPGLAVRILGEITDEKLEIVRDADEILLEEIVAAGLYRKTSQVFAVLLPVQSVGVMGDGRTYERAIALRAVETQDFMTADWARIPFDVLARISTRIINEVRGVNRVVYDISSKPPATIEWE